MDQVLSVIEEVQKKIEELEKKLRKSEEERLRLQQMYRSFVGARENEKFSKIENIREKYNRCVKDDTVRDCRNQHILGDLKRIETRANMVSAKTDRLRILRHHYVSYIDNYCPSIKMNRSHLIPSLPGVYRNAVCYPTTKSNYGFSDLSSSRERFAYTHKTSSWFDQSSGAKDMKTKLINDDLETGSASKPGMELNSLYKKQNMSSTAFDHSSAYGGLILKNSSVKFNEDIVSFNKGAKQTPNINQNFGIERKNVGNHDYRTKMSSHIEIANSTPMPHNSKENAPSTRRASEYFRDDIASIDTKKWKTDKLFSDNSDCEPPEKYVEERNGSTEERQILDNTNITRLRYFNNDPKEYDPVSNTSVSENWVQDLSTRNGRIRDTLQEEKDALHNGVNDSYNKLGKSIIDISTEKESDNISKEGEHTMQNYTEDDGVRLNDGPNSDFQLSAESNEKCVFRSDENDDAESVIEKNENKVLDETAVEAELSNNTCGDISELVVDNESSISIPEEINILTEIFEKENDCQNPEISSNNYNVEINSEIDVQEPCAEESTHDNHTEEQSSYMNMEVSNGIFPNEIVPNELTVEFDLSSLPTEDCIQLPKEQTLELYPEEMAERFYRQNRAEEYAQEIPLNFLDENTASAISHNVIDLSDVGEDMTLQNSADEKSSEQPIYDTVKNVRDTEYADSTECKEIDSRSREQPFDGKDINFQDTQLDVNYTIQENVKFNVNENMTSDDSASKCPNVDQPKITEPVTDVYSMQENGQKIELKLDFHSSPNEISLNVSENVPLDVKIGKEVMSSVCSNEVENKQIKDINPGEFPIDFPKEYTENNTVDENLAAIDLNSSENFELDETSKALQHLEINKGSPSTTNKQSENANPDLDAPYESSNYTNVNYEHNGNSFETENSKHADLQQPVVNAGDLNTDFIENKQKYQDNVKNQNYDENNYMHEQSYVADQYLATDAGFQPQGAPQNIYPEDITNVEYYDENFRYEDNGLDQRYDQTAYEYDGDYGIEQDASTNDQYKNNTQSEMMGNTVSNQPYPQDDTMGYHDNPDNVIYNPEEYNYTDDYRVNENISGPHYQTVDSEETYNIAEGKETSYPENTLNQQYPHPSSYGYDETANSHYDQRAYGYEGQDADDAYYPNNTPVALENHTFNYDENLANSPYQGNQYVYDSPDILPEQEYLKNDSYNYSEVDINVGNSGEYENNFQKKSDNTSSQYSEVPYSDQQYPTHDLYGQEVLPQTGVEVQDLQGTNLPINNELKTETNTESDDNLNNHINKNPT